MCILIYKVKRTNIQTTPTSFHALYYENISSKDQQREQLCKDIHTTTPTSFCAFFIWKQRTKIKLRVWIRIKNTNLKYMQNINRELVTVGL